MGQFIEFLAMGMGTHTDASGNIIWPGTQAAAPAAPAPDSAPDAAPVSAPAQAVAPGPAVPAVKATTPKAAIPEPPVVGQASPDDLAAVQKKTLLGG